MIKNTEYMAIIKENGLLWTPKDALTDVLNNNIGKTGAFKKGKKILIIGLDDTNNKELNYDISFVQAGMHITEMISLIDIFKTILIKDMGF